MTKSLLASFLQHTYVRSNLVYRISLLTEFLNFVFFTDNDKGVKENVIEQFAKNSKESLKDIDFLKALPQSFLETFTRDSFREELDNMSKELEHLPVLSITVPVILPSEHIEAIGQWIRNVISPNAMLDISVDSTISSGCMFVWKDILYDFSLEHYLNLHKKEIYTQVISSLSEGQG